MKAVNITECFEKFDDTYSPKIVGDLNGQYVLLVRLEGDKVPWHTHDNEDEMFFVIDGKLQIHERDKITNLQAGEFYIVQRGIEHRVVPEGHVKSILFEPKGIKHTENVKSEITKASYDQLDI